jgi:hypothetical protein
MLARSAEALFARLIDYAGLFPPAALPMAEAVRGYDRYRRGEHAWMLGRFVVPAANAHEVPSDFPLTVLGDAPFDVVETKEIVEANGRTVYVETNDLATIPELARRGLRAKIRTGGVTADAFPPVDFIAQFIRACRDHGVVFKATAGLHHPLRCVKPLTYEANAPTGTMHGFVNVFMAAAIADRAEEVLTASDFSFDDDAASWRDVRVSTEEIATMRRTLATSFGSCSFEEPIADLKELGWL